ncbi:hypothetical protein BZK37_06210 [Enterococcus casseliflavus]|nr:hypothetical protein BZK37_06210 [Enterococcus casseliflavus]
MSIRGQTIPDGESPIAQCSLFDELTEVFCFSKKQTKVVPRNDRPSQRLFFGKAFFIKKEEKL